MNDPDFEARDENIRHWAEQEVDIGNRNISQETNEHDIYQAGRQRRDELNRWWQENRER